jgi:hypothetical protein
MATSEPKIISPHSGGWLDHIRTAIFALQLASELTRDEDEIAMCQQEIRRLQEGLAAHAHRRDGALFTEATVALPGTKVIPNYEPPDKGWQITFGPFRQPPEPKPAEEHDDGDDHAVENDS